MDLQVTHGPLLALQREMASDATFRSLCTAHGLPWAPTAGYEPRWYNGPPPERVEVLFLMAEPGAITSTEAQNLKPAVEWQPWIGAKNLRLQETYWLENLRTLCRHVWPENTEAEMDARVGGSCTFWMSLPPGAQTDLIPSPLLHYFLDRYLPRLLALFPDAVVLAAGAKARERLRSIGVVAESCWAFTRPGCLQPRARESWRASGMAIARKLGRGQHAESNPPPAPRTESPDRAAPSLARPVGAATVEPSIPAGSILGTERITVLAPSNPRRPGTHAHMAFALYRTGITVSEWREACRVAGGEHFRHMVGYLSPDIRAGHIKLN